MKHYKDNDNNLYAIDSESHAYILPAGCVQITDGEAESIREAKKVEEEAAIPASIKVKNSIIATETAQTPRRIREALLEIADKVGADCTFLRNLDANIAAERVKIK